MSGLLAELKRRNVFRVGVAYVVTAWLIAQVADMAADAFAAPDWVMRMLIVVLALGLPVALFFAWVYELTPEGIKREKDVDRTQSLTPQTGQKLNRGIIVILSVAIALLLVDRFWLSGNAADGPSVGEFDKSIAVLPFDDFSPEGDQEWFADGLTEEILNALAKTPDLRVASRTASFRYRDSSAGIDQIAAELKVAHILEGSVRRAGEDIRVTAQLISVDDGSHVWSDNFDGSIEDTIGIQEDISKAIARAMKTVMDPEQLESMLSVGTATVPAYEAFLKGASARTAAWMNMANFGDDSYVEYFDEARRLDPGFARAHFQVGNHLADLVLDTMPSAQLDPSHPEHLDQFRSAMNQAIMAANDPAERQHYEAVLAGGELRLAEAMAKLTDYVDQHPNDIDASARLIRFAGWVGAHDLGLRVLDRQVERFGSDAFLLMSASWEYYRLGETRKGADIARRLLESGSPTSNILYQAHRALLWDGAVEEAAKLVARLEGAPRAEALAMVRMRQACAEGRREDAEHQFELLSEDRDDVWGGTSLDWLAMSILTTPHEASLWLKEQGGTDGSYGVVSLLQYPQFDPTPFPDLMTLLAREGIDRPDAVAPPFACPAPTDQ